MGPILITVKRSDEDREYDLAVQPDLPLSQISEFIAAGLHWEIEESGFEIKDLQTGIVLDSSNTLADAIVWHGTRLEFTPMSKKPDNPSGFVWNQID